MLLWNDSQPDYKKSVSYRIVYAGCIIILFFLGYKWQSNLSSVMDILAADEAEYLRNGISLFDKVYKIGDQVITSGINFFPCLRIQKLNCIT